MSSHSQKGEQQAKLYRDHNLQVIFGVTLMAVLGVASIAPAFPKIMDGLGITPGEVGLLITVFTLPGIILTPFLGILADRFGRKKILVPALFLFAFAGAACGLARDMKILLLFRFLQGMGASPLASLSGTIIGDLYSGQNRSTAMGYNASVLSIGTASYPAIGGALALLGWHYPFFLPLLAIPVGLVSIFVLKNPEPVSAQGFGEYMRGAVKVIRNRHVIGLFFVSVATFVILYGSVLTYFPLLLADRFGASSFTIGMITSVMSVTTGLTSTQMGRLTRTISELNLIKVAFLFYAAALVIIPSVKGLWVFLIPMMIYGVGMGLNIPAIMSAMAGLAPMEHRGVLMSVNGMVLRIGQTLGPLVMGVVFMLWGTAGTFYMGAALALITFGITTIVLK